MLIVAFVVMMVGVFVRTVPGMSFGLLSYPFAIFFMLFVNLPPLLFVTSAPKFRRPKRQPVKPVPEHLEESEMSSNAGSITSVCIQKSKD